MFTAAFLLCSLLLQQSAAADAGDLVVMPEVGVEPEPSFCPQICALASAIAEEPHPLCLVCIKLGLLQAELEDSTPEDGGPADTPDKRSRGMLGYRRVGAFKPDLRLLNGINMVVEMQQWQHEHAGGRSLEQRGKRFLGVPTLIPPSGTRPPSPPPGAWACEGRCQGMKRMQSSEVGRELAVMECMRCMVRSRLPPRPPLRSGYGKRTYRRMLPLQMKNKGGGRFLGLPMVYNGDSPRRTTSELAPDGGLMVMMGSGIGKRGVRAASAPGYIRKCRLTCRTRNKTAECLRCVAKLHNSTLRKAHRRARFLDHM